MGYMQRALELSREALGLSSPNPPVGAVVVKDGQVVGEGHTLPPGQAHAEVIALLQAGERARGADLYTTLEPCCHFGKTPPCTRDIIRAGISRVHVATLDPNPLVNGKGLSELEDAGLSVHLNECGEEARQVAEAYTKFVATGRPFVTAKFAMSLDGKIATASGDSRWISSEESRRRAAELRRQSDAVMVGIGTVLADDPRLTARDEAGGNLPRQPLRVVVEGAATLPPGAQLLREPGQVLVATPKVADDRAAALAGDGAEVLHLPAGDDLVDLEALMQALGQRGVTCLLVEGGGVLLGSLFDRGLVDKVVAFVSPVILGGRDAPTPVAGVGAVAMAGAVRLVRSKAELIGEDAMITGYVR